MRDSFPLVEIDNQNKEYLFVLTNFENRPLTKGQKMSGYMRGNFSEGINYRLKNVRAYERNFISHTAP